MQRKRFTIVCEDNDRADVVTRLSSRSLEHGVRSRPVIKGNVVEVIIQGDEDDLVRFYEDVRTDEPVEVTQLRDDAGPAREPGFTIVTADTLSAVAPLAPQNDMFQVELDISQVRARIRELRRTDFTIDPLTR